MFKLSYDPVGVIRDFDTRSFNLVPFTRAYKAEMVSNFLAFIPFGLLLGVSFKRVSFARKLAIMFASSLAVEIIQFALPIGVADVTDLITNTLGGFAGLAAYAMLRKPRYERTLDWCVVAIVAIILLAILYLRFFVLIVRY